jgi:hypothetical protein
MTCLECGNCRVGTDLLYYCPARNEFVITEKPAIDKVRAGSHWKKGDKEYEINRRRLRKDREIS